MLGMVPDNDIEGHFEIVLGHLLSETWRELWSSLSIKIHSFETLGLKRDMPDRAIWQTCQERQIILVTGNRNDDGPDSLEATIRSSNTATSLPVFTLADLDRVLDSPAYADQVAEQLIDRLMNLETIRGAGRIWLP